MEQPPLPERTILVCEVGSTAHGISVGSDDLDLMGVCLEGPATTVGLGSFEQDIYRTAALREGRHDARSMPGDLDRVIYSARKFCRLALKGNPSVQALLFGPTVMLTPTGEGLRALWREFGSQRVVRSHLGYMDEQIARLEGRRGQKSVKRPELIEAHGFDTKYAAHIIRLGMQGVAYAQTGRIPIPLPYDQADLICALRRGEIERSHAMTLCAEWKDALETAHHENPSGLPRHPDEGAVNAWLIAEHLAAWEAA